MEPEGGGLQCDLIVSAELNLCYTRTHMLIMWSFQKNELGLISLWAAVAAVVREAEVAVAVMSACLCVERRNRVFQLDESLLSDVSGL